MDDEAVSPIANVKSDANLVARARAGEETAWSAIVELHWRQVWSLSRMVLREEQGAEEVAQETFRIARDRLVGFEGDRTLSGWIQAICRQRALDELRRRSRQAAADPQAVRSDLERALASLEPEEREALLLTTSGSAPEELAVALGVPAATVRSRCARARARLLDAPDRGGVR